MTAVALQTADRVRGQGDRSRNCSLIVRQQSKIRGTLILNGSADRDHTRELFAGHSKRNRTVGILILILADIAACLCDKILDDLRVVCRTGIQLLVVADLLPRHVQVGLRGRRVAVHIVQHRERRRHRCRSRPPRLPSTLPYRC